MVEEVAHWQEEAHSYRQHTEEAATRGVDLRSLRPVQHSGFDAVGKK